MPEGDFDSSFKLPLTDNTHELTFIVFEDSLFKALVSTSENVNVFVYGDSLLGNSLPDTTFKSLQVKLPARKKGYRVKIVSSSTSEERCPSFNLRLAMKSLRVIKEEEDLACDRETETLPSKFSLRGDLLAVDKLF